MLQLKLKNIVKFSLLFSLLFYSSAIFSQTNDDVNFYPLHVGDKWQYKVEYIYRDSDKDSSYYLTVEVRGIDTLNGKKYYAITNSENYCLKFLRIDSTDATLWENDDMIDSLSMNVGDMMLCTASSNPKTCIKDSVENIFGEDRRVKTFVPINIPTLQKAINFQSSFEVKYLYKYAFGIGEIYSESSDIGIEASKIIRTLVYAKVDGTEYGNYISNDFNFYPLHVGDKWQYYVDEKYVSEDGKDTSYYVTSEVVGKDIFDGKTYYAISDGYKNYVKFVRIDSTDFSVWEYKDGMECMVDSLSMIAGADGFRNECYGFVDCVRDSVEEVFDKMVRVKRMNYVAPVTCQYAQRKIYDNAYGIGRIYTRIEQPTPYGSDFITQKLVYAKVNSTEYGKLPDNVEENNLENFTFRLEQNYPNPFNPSTTIKYSIPVDVSRESSVVSLKVYDILGREVATLVNSEQKTGNYEVTFDASNLTSGIYFYKLQSGSFVKSRKMLLLK